MDVNISANTLFHFTPTKINLLNILANGLYVRYSLENYESLIDGAAEIVFPMVSFCDIPLSHVKRHSSVYGKYAIGLTKDWGKSKKINPVIYTYPGSNTATILNDLKSNIESFFDIKEESEPILNRPVKARQIIGSRLKHEQSDKDTNPTLSDSLYGKQYDLSTKLAHFIKNIKPYEGKFYRNNGYLESPVNFYDEREWRYTLSRDFFRPFDLKDSYSAKYYTDPIKRRAINIKLSKFIKLTFRPNDIRFIIVNKDNEIPGMITELETVFGNTCSHNDLKLLSTRLISLEQIMESI